MGKYVTSKKTTDYFGKIFASNNCGFYQIVLANTTTRMKAVFLTTNTEVWVTSTQVDLGGVVDPYFPSMRGVGYHGAALATTDKDGKQLKEYVYWYGMLDRCYGNRALKAYEDCIVSEEFHDFSYFQQWFHKQVGRYSSDYELDKDILSNGVCKVYAEDTCVLVPPTINIFFAKTGARTHEKYEGSSYPIGVSWHKPSNSFKSVYNNGGNRVESYHDNEWEAFLAYKRAKEARAKELAQEYYGLIDHRVYDKLMNYKVLLTD